MLSNTKGKGDGCYQHKLLRQVPGGASFFQDSDVVKDEEKITFCYITILAYVTFFIGVINNSLEVLLVG